MFKNVSVYQINLDRLTNRCITDVDGTNTMLPSQLINTLWYGGRFGF